MRDAADLRQLDGIVGEGVVVNHQVRGGVTDDVLEFGEGQPPVEWDEHSSELPTGELDLEEVGVVLGEDGYPVAEVDPELVLQCGGQPAGAVIHLAVGENSPSAEIVHGDLVTARRRVVGNPVIGAWAHVIFPFGSSED